MGFLVVGHLKVKLIESDTITQLKIGLLQLLLGDKSDPNNIVEPLSPDLYIGLAVFSEV
jgi:type IV pilus assembly protein PilY1